jgi:rhamnogalacturonyl hydrolase YesR
MLRKVEASFEKLRVYCEKENFTGWDPFDGLNSKLFNSLPVIRSNKWTRLIWIQLFKKNPVNLRKFSLVSKGVNPKGLGLFLSAYCRLYKVDPKAEYLQKIDMLASQLIDLRTKGYSGSCWGYNFDWQSKAFFQPKFTPTIVASTFIGYALLDAFDITKNELYKTHALSVCDFILKDLNRTVDSDGDFAFSYSPLDNTQVFNASLLGSRMLARAYSYSLNKSLLEPAKKSVSFCCKHQKEDGSWAYSTLPFHQWIDNFHTGFNLECISEYQKYSNDHTFVVNIDKGFKYYTESFFTGEGIPKYYNNSVYPVDVHATSQLIITLSRLGKLKEEIQLADKVLNWTIDNMQHESGYFYYQKWKRVLIKIPYMRWSQSWMFFALAVYISDFKQSSELLNGSFVEASNITS